MLAAAAAQLVGMHLAPQALAAGALAGSRAAGSWVASRSSTHAASDSPAGSGARGYAAEAAAGVREVATVQDYDAIMKQLAEHGSLGIIDFTAKWCGPCKAIAPIYEQLAGQYPQVAFLKVDIDNADMLPVVTDHGITGVPTFAVYKGASKVENFTGARVDMLRAVLQKHAS